MKQLLLLLFFLCLSANAQQKFTVYFDTGAAELSVTSVQKLGEWIDANPDIAIETIDGYTDKSGTTEHNMELSKRRAAYIIAQLKCKETNLDYALSRAFGEEQAVGYNHASDRKVDILYNKQEYSKPRQAVETELTQQFKNAKVGDIIRLKNVNFRGGTTYILNASKPALKELLNVMLSNPKVKIDIQGHICCDIDDVGDLSGKRADEVFLYLTNNGIDKNRVTTRGYGGHRPIYKIPELNNDEMAQNRRVEIEILAN
jgi:outer membrane protein OmpA-like peptidoglycan-associated protein